MQGKSWGHTPSSSFREGTLVQLRKSVQYSPAFADMVLTHREDAVPDKAEDYTSEAIALHPADSQEEDYYFYIPRTKDVVKRATFTKCEVYTESIIPALLRQYNDEMTAAAKLQRPSYDIEPLSTLSLDTAIAKRMATVATTKEMPFRVDSEDGHAESFQRRFSSNMCCRSRLRDHGSIHSFIYVEKWSNAIRKQG